MIYSIGYQIKTPKDMVQQLSRLGITHLIDVRSKPYGRKTAFNKKEFSLFLETNGLWYEHHPELGGFSEISDEAINWLSAFQKHRKVCIMCMEADPARCHRSTEIGRRLRELGVEVVHLI